MVGATARLSGHDRLALTEHLDRALAALSAGMAAPGPALWPLRRDLAALRAVGAALDPDLAAFDRALECYHEVARATDPWLADLGWWAELAAACRPTEARVDGVPVIAAEAGRRHGGTATVQQSAMNVAFSSRTAAAVRRCTSGFGERSTAPAYRRPRPTGWPAPFCACRFVPWPSARSTPAPARIWLRRPATGSPAPASARASGLGRKRCSSCPRRWP